ncbi:probable ribonuclease 11 isoform X3 [Acinonyx jubatus]|uniref:Probable ribonuclease 11 isoform X3 n=1 Tax=Acinonyx jubatus TaxID=32536 RepID=A0ABM3Q8G6_ACIJB|nr:probable ribonuclease 11 isoform X3 [Acinonyx jubatus]
MWNMACTGASGLSATTAPPPNPHSVSPSKFTTGQQRRCVKQEAYGQGRQVLTSSEKRELLLHEIIEMLWSPKTILIKKN